MYHKFETYVDPIGGNEYIYCIDCAMDEGLQDKYPTCEEYEDFLKIQEVIES
jgi:hypothetical protein